MSQDFVDDVLLFDAGDDLHPGSPQQPQACFCTYAVLLVTDIPDANGKVSCESNPASLPSAVKGSFRSIPAFDPCSLQGSPWHFAAPTKLEWYCQLNTHSAIIHR